MKEANIAEMTKRNILANAFFKCEVCSKTLGYGKEEETPHFYYIIPLLNGGTTKETNIAVLCAEDGARLHKLDKEDLLRVAMYREIAEPDT